MWFGIKGLATWNKEQPHKVAHFGTREKFLKNFLLSLEVLEGLGTWLKKKVASDVDNCMGARCWARQLNERCYHGAKSMLALRHGHDINNKLQ